MLVFAPEPAYVSRYHPTNARERYLRALAEEEAARQAYVNDLSQQFTDPYYGSGDDSNYYSFQYRPTPDELLEARAREMQQRQRQVAAYHARREQQQLRQQELEHELERRERQQAFTRRREWMRQQQLEQQKQQAAELQQFLRARLMQKEQEEREAYSNTLRALFGDMTGKEKPLHCEATNASPEANVAFVLTPKKGFPTQEEQNEAAAAIQSSHRSNQHRQKSLTSLSQLRESLATLKSSFIFPSSPVFDPNSLNATSPKLLYNPTNGPIHVYEDELVRLLTKLDAIESGGDAVVRNERKVLVHRVEAALAELERMKDRAWKSWKEEHTERMEVGEESNAISSASPTGELEQTEEHMVEDLLSVELNSFLSGNSIEPVEQLLSSPADAVVVETESHESDRSAPITPSELALEDVRLESASPSVLSSPSPAHENRSTSSPESSVTGATSSSQPGVDQDADAIEVDTPATVDNAPSEDTEQDDSFLSRTLPPSDFDATSSMLAPPVLNDQPSSSVGEGVEEIEDMVVIGDVRDSSAAAGTSNFELQHDTDSAEVISDTSSIVGSELSANSGPIENDFVVV